MCLQMRSMCERCQGPLTPSAEAYICSYECTFCAECTKKLNQICPNCAGELVRRPRRTTAWPFTQVCRPRAETGLSLFLIIGGGIACNGGLGAEAHGADLID